MAYDNGNISTYHFDDHDFGTGANITQVIAVPLDGISTVTPGQGRSGRVVGATVYNVTENFAGSSSDAGIQVGDGTDADIYFDSGLVLNEDVDATESVYLLDDGAKVRIPAGKTSVTVTFVASAGSPTGIAHVALDILWDGPSR